MLILAVNPGSTSTKLGIFRDEQALCKLTVPHSSEDLAKFKRIADQEEYRYKAIESFLTEQGFSADDFDCVVARGGGLLRMKSGAYRINEEMLDELKNIRLGEHASTLAAGIAYRMMEPLGRPAYIYDAITGHWYQSAIQVRLGLRSAYV